MKQIMKKKKSFMIKIADWRSSGWASLSHRAVLLANTLLCRITAVMKMMLIVCLVISTETILEGVLLKGSGVVMTTSYRELCSQWDARILATFYSRKMAIKSVIIIKS